MVMLLSMMVGCTKTTAEQSFGAGCTAYLENLPKEYELLPEGIRDKVEITVSLRNVSSNKRYSNKLNYANGFRQSIDLLPGTYDVSNVHISEKSLAMLDVEVKLESIKVDKDSQFELPVYVKSPTDFIAAIENNKPKAEILKEDVYSRKVQLNGEIIDINNIRNTVKFDEPPTNKNLAPAETFLIPSSNNEGVSLIVQNQTNTYAPVSKATFVGVQFYGSNVVFPKGITLGTGLDAICHAQDGILGTPDYFLGTPLIGLGYDNTTVVYLDKESGDRISLNIKPSHSFASFITYEFNKYE
jgi:hypothetical protein